MAELKIKTVVLKHGTKTNLDKSNIVLKKGEAVLDTTTKLFRIGNGTDPIKDLKEASLAVPGDLILNENAFNFKKIQELKGEGYYQLLDDGKEDGLETYGYQWLKCENFPVTYNQIYDGCMIFSVNGPTLDDTPLVYDEESASKVCGGVDYNTLNNTDGVYQFEATNDVSSSFSTYYEDFVKPNGLVGYKGMMVTTTNSGLDTKEKMGSVFGGTWKSLATKAECGVDQYVCTAHDNDPATLTSKILGSFKGMRISMYLPSVSDTSVALQYAVNVYGGSWDIIDADQSATHIFQMYKTSN